MGEFKIKCGGKFDIYFNDDDERHRVTVEVHDECEGENIPIVEVLKNDGTPLKPEKTRTLSNGGGITTLPVRPGEMVRIT